MNALYPLTVMPGLAPGIHAFMARRFQDVDGRNECGYDGNVSEGRCC